MSLEITLQDVVDKYESFEGPGQNNKFQSWLQKEFDKGNLTTSQILNYMSELAASLEDMPIIENAETEE